MTLVQVLTALWTVELQHATVTDPEIRGQGDIPTVGDGKIAGVEGVRVEVGCIEHLSFAVHRRRSLEIREGRTLCLVFDEDPPFAGDERLEFRS